MPHRLLVVWHLTRECLFVVWLLESSKADNSLSFIELSVGCATNPSNNTLCKDFKYHLLFAVLAFHKFKVKFNHAEFESGLQMPFYMHCSEAQTLIISHVAAGCTYCGGYRGVTP